MDKMYKDEKIQTILPELQNFSRDVGIPIQSLNEPSLKVTYFYKLFCKKHRDTVWFLDGKIYGIKYNELSEDKIEIFERNNSNKYIYKVLIGSDNTDDRRLLLLLSVIIIIFLTNNTLYFFPIVSTILILFLTRDRILNLIYKIRINFLHR